MRGGAPALLAAAVLCLGAAAAAAGRSETDPGVTPTSIEIGGTFPLTGIRSMYAAIPEAEAAYFDYVNAHGGVNGRSIDFEYLDDANDPAQTVPQTQKLVEQDGVFAVFGSYATPNNLAVFDYLNQRQVPQVLIDSGAEYWGYDYKTHPWTIGFIPDFPGEARIYGEFIRAHLPNAKVGVLYSNQPAGLDLLNGLRAGLGLGNKKVIVATQASDSTQTDETQQMLALKNAGADVFFCAVASPQSIQALVAAAQLGWQRRATFVAGYGATDPSMKAAVSSGAYIDGDISSQYQVDSNNPAEASWPGVVLGKQILARYAPGLDPANRIVWTGLATAWTMVYALRQAGSTPTRAGLMTALHSLDPAEAKNPFLYPGFVLQTSSTDNFPIEQQILVRWTGGSSGYWQPFGKVYDHAR